MTFNELVKGIDFEKIETRLMANHDGFIMNSLVRCGIDSPTSFSLLWGDKMASYKDFPPKLREVVTGIIQEEKKKSESLDPQEKRIHNIIIDLLQILYEQQVRSTVIEARIKAIFYE